MPGRGYRFLPDVIKISRSEIRPITIQVTIELTLDGREPFADKEEIARKVTAALRGDRERHELRRRATRDPHAFRLYREARCHVMRYTSASWQKSARCYEQATAQAPSFALADAVPSPVSTRPWLSTPSRPGSAGPPVSNLA